MNDDVDDATLLERLRRTQEESADDGYADFYQQVSLHDILATQSQLFCRLSAPTF